MSAYLAVFSSARSLSSCCWVFWRKLHDLHAVRKSPITTKALERFGALYQIEAQIRGKPPRERRRIRRARAVPLLDSMKVRSHVSDASGKSDTSKAIQYALNRRVALVLLQRRSSRDR
ncbi:IS66 family transposase [Burkholderia ubonensis]|uniref:IS66 family transposase n=1 Tax=Burkholderia ubonensis TaxID=101571 RepID=UPI0009B42E46